MDCLKKFPFFGSKRGADLSVKIRALANATDSKDQIDRLYSILGILDAKATGLLGVNSFFIAILIGLLGLKDIKETLPHRFTAGAEIALVLLVISSIFCLLIVRVSWKFLRKVSAVGTGYSFDKEIKRLSNVIDDRTHFYWFAWFGAISGFLIPALAWITS
jgi:hypothetical protein